MKVCRVCYTEYTADDDFCPLDGSPLVVQGPGEGRVVVAWDVTPADEAPTQYVAVPRQPAPAQTGPDNSKWLYVVLGGLVAIILMGGGYLFLTGQRGKDPEWTGTQGTGSQTSTPANNTAGDNRNQNSVDPTPFSDTAPPGNKYPIGNTNTKPVSSLERTFRRTYYGNVDTGRVAMDLERSGRSLTGKVKPVGRYADIYLDGYVDDDGTFKMDEKSDIGVVTGVYRGRFNSDGTMTGTWSNPGGDKTRSLFLRRQ